MRRSDDLIRNIKIASSEDGSSARKTNQETQDKLRKCATSYLPYSHYASICCIHYMQCVRRAFRTRERETFQIKEKRGTEKVEAASSTPKQFVSQHISAEM